MLTTRLIARLTYAKPDLALLDAAKDKTDSTTDAIERALERGANIDAVDIRIEGEFNYIGYKYTALLWSVHTGLTEKVKFLIERGAETNARTARGNNILHIAARQGHLALYHFLAQAHPHLRSVKGENNLTPDQIASKYHQKEVKELCDAFYSNQYFPVVKVAVPDEVILNIVRQIPSITVFNSLRFANKAWYGLFQDVSLKGMSEKKLRTYLLPTLQASDWQTIFKHYYPDVPLPSDVAPYEAFVRQIHKAYIIGTPYQSFYEKSEFGKFMNDVSHLVDIWNRGSHWNYFPFSEAEAQKSFDNVIKQREVAIFGSFKLASDKEYAQIPRIPDALTTAYMSRYKSAHKKTPHVRKDSHDQVWLDITYRSPILEVKIDTDTALALLASANRCITASPQGITECDGYNMSDFIYHAYHDIGNKEAHFNPRR